MSWAFLHLAWVRLLSGVFVYVAIGILFQRCERYWPIREFETKPERRLDWLAYGLSLFYDGVYGTYIARALIRSPVLAWLHSVHAYLERLPAVIGCLVYFLAFDFFAYWLHRLLHHRWLWSTHAFHHSSRHLNWLAGNRNTLVHHLLSANAGTLALMLAPVAGPFVWMRILYGVAYNSFIHSNIRIKSRILNAIFVTGEQHFVHHAKDVRAGNSNFAFLFSFWDRIFGTWVDPRSMPADFELGLGYAIETRRLMLGLPPAATATSRTAVQVPAGDSSSSLRA
jgi:sterol desaturase/sphingolipid hydroxylase (fatty acid hydroxylase superfamily)